jgi:hypothetical protein
MKKIIFLIIFPILVFSQNIKGKITNSNLQPIAGASVYLDGTTIGTISDSEGLFEITSNNKYNTLLIVKYLGYEDIYVSNPYEKEFYAFVLVPKINEIETVVIVKDGFTRKQKLQLFREQFLGLTKYGKACKIINEDAIDFNYDLETFIFTASCPEPVRVENPLLGYVIDFDLQDFYVKFNFKTIKSVNAIQSLFLGTVKYTKTKIDEKIIKNRNDVYFGSAVDFFKGIINNSWSEKKFILYEGKFPVLANDYFKVLKKNDLYEVTVTSTNKVSFSIGGIKRNNFYADFNLLYSKKRQSRVIFKTEIFFVDAFGNNSHKDQIIFGGDIGRQKAGNTLPLDFEPEILEKEVKK